MEYFKSRININLVNLPVWPISVCVPPSSDHLLFMGVSTAITLLKSTPNEVVALTAAAVPLKLKIDMSRGKMGIEFVLAEAEFI